MSNFNEKDHPRAADGKFTDGNKTVSAIRKYSSDPERDLEHGNIPNARSDDYKELSADEMKVRLQRELPEDNTPTFGSQEELDKLLGEEFKDVKGQAAIDKLLQEKRGHVKGAFHRDDIGDIDLLWGNEYLGLQHILRQREKQGINTTEFLKDLSDVIEKGQFYQKNTNGNFEFLHNGKMVIIAPEYHGNKLTFVLTAYKTRKSTVG